MRIVQEFGGSLSPDSIRESTHITKKQSIKGVFIDFIPSSISTRQTVRGLFCNQRLKELAKAENSGRGV